LSNVQCRTSPEGSVPLDVLGVLVAGAGVTTGGVRVIVEVAEPVGVARLVAVTVTVCDEVIVAGAV
jgi:hypothetical protein